MLLKTDLDHIGARRIACHAPVGRFSYPASAGLRLNSDMVHGRELFV